MTDDSLRSWAYGLLVAGGALILGGAVTMAFFWWAVSGSGWAGPWWMPGHMLMFQTTLPFAAFVLWGLVAGGLVLWSGIRMRPGGPGDGSLEGALALVGSILSFPVMGGFMFGALLGVVGGVLALTTGGRGAGA